MGIFALLAFTISFDHFILISKNWLRTIIGTVNLSHHKVGYLERFYFFYNSTVPLLLAARSMTS